MHIYKWTEHNVKFYLAQQKFTHPHRIQLHFGLMYSQLEYIGYLS